jgi:membrane-associated phospholipid phosphatase
VDTFLHSMDWILPLRSPIATWIFQVFTWLGYTPFFLLFMPLGYWVWDKRVFTRIAMIVLISALLNSYLKYLFQDPRPDAMYRLDAHVGTSFGLPSGHAQTAVVLWFWLAYEMRRRVFWWLAAVMVTGIVFSRLYLGAEGSPHFVA